MIDTEFMDALRRPVGWTASCRTGGTHAVVRSCCCRDMVGGETHGCLMAIPKVYRGGGDRWRWERLGGDEEEHALCLALSPTNTAARPPRLLRGTSLFPAMSTSN